MVELSLVQLESRHHASYLSEAILQQVHTGDRPHSVLSSCRDIIVRCGFGQPSSAEPPPLHSIMFALCSPLLRHTLKEIAASSLADESSQSNHSVAILLPNVDVSVVGGLVSVVYTGSMVGRRGDCEAVVDLLCNGFCVDQQRQSFDCQPITETTADDETAFSRQKTGDIADDGMPLNSVTETVEDLMNCVKKEEQDVDNDVDDDSLTTTAVATIHANSSANNVGSKHSVRRAKSNHRKHKMPFQCVLCNFTTCRQRAFNLHMTTLHREQIENGDSLTDRTLDKLVHCGREKRNHICRLCPFKTVRKRVLKEHLHSHMDNGSISIGEKRTANKDKKFECGQCSYKCKTKQLLSVHVNRHGDYRPWKCDQCPYSAKYRNNLRSHVRFHNGSGALKCPQCSYAVDNARVLSKHVIFVHRDDSTQGDDGVEERSLLKCEQCSFTTTTRARFARHVFRHSNNGKNIFSCSFCDALFSRRSALKDHIASNHHDAIDNKTPPSTEKRDFKCPYCDHIATQSANLWTHVQFKHNKQGRRFVCQYCSYSCVAKQNLQIHIRARHTGEKPFQCEFCSYCSSRKSTLQNHLRIHSEEKVFQCSMCEYRGRTKVNLDVHMRKHSDERILHCDQCSFTSTVHENLRQHYRKHTGERPFGCSSCDYSASHKGNLKKHMRTNHNAEKA